MWIFGSVGGFGGLEGLYLELEFKVEGSVNLDLDIWCEGVTGAVGRTFELILGSAHLGVGSTGLALTFGGLCPSGDRCLAFSVPVIPQMSQGHAGPPLLFLLGCISPHCLNVSVLQASLCPLLTLPESVSLSLSDSLSLAVSLFLWVQLLDYHSESLCLFSICFLASLSLSVSAFLSLTISPSLSLPASLSLSPPRWFPLRLSRGPNSRPRIEFSGNKGK